MWLDKQGWEIQPYENPKLEYEFKSLSVARQRFENVEMPLWMGFLSMKISVIVWNIKHPKHKIILRWDWGRHKLTPFWVKRSKYIRP